ncbi:14808_t:CDS:2, partial [Gigaspora rosea]
EPTLDIPSSNRPFLNSLLEKAYKHIAPNSAYEKRLRNLWDDQLCPFGVGRFSVTVYETAHIFDSYQPLPSKNGHSDPTTDFNVQMFARNLMKLEAADHEAAWLRDPLPVKALRNYVDYPPVNISTLI